MKPIVKKARKTGGPSATEGSWVARGAQSVIDRLRIHDPSFSVMRRAVRSAVFVPVIVAMGLTIGNSQTTTFSAIGAICLLLLVGFSGPAAVVLGRQLVLVATCAGAIVLGTLCSGQPVVAVSVTAAVGFAVTFAGILGPTVARGCTGVLVVFVASVSLPSSVDQIWWRLAGFGLASAVVIPVSVLFLPEPAINRLRTLMARLAADLGDLAALRAGHGPALADQDVVDAAQRSIDDLAAAYEGSAILPIGVADDEHATGQLVGYLIAVGQQLLHGVTQTADSRTVRSRRDADQSLYAACSRAFRHCARLLAASPPHTIRYPAAIADTAQIRDELLAIRIRSGDAVVAQLREYAQTRRPAAIPPLTEAEVDAVELFKTVDLSVRPRALGRATLLVLETTASVARINPSSNAFPAGVIAWLRSALTRARPFLRVNSVWCRNSLRVALALATAVLVIELADVPHGFWVLLGTITALRSSAWDTRTCATRAVAGTAVGVAAASAALWVVGESRPTVWALLPVAVFIAVLAAGSASLQAGQAAFTFTVLVLLRVLHPTTNFGLLRLDDVATGCAVAVVVGRLCWPRGAAGVLGRALADRARCHLADAPRQHQPAGWRPDKRHHAASNGSAGTGDPSARKGRVGTNDGCLRPPRRSAAAIPLGTPS